MSVYLVPLRSFRAWRQRNGFGTAPRAMASIAFSRDGEEDTVIIVGRPLWRAVPERWGVRIESYLADMVLPHEALHIALRAMGERAASTALDVRWPHGPPR